MARFNGVIFASYPGPAKEARTTFQISPCRWLPRTSLRSSLGWPGLRWLCEMVATFTGVTGIVLSAIGLISFTIEGSHWVFDHQRSWLAFSPALMFVLVVIACLPQRSAIAE